MAVSLCDEMAAFHKYHLLKQYCGFGFFEPNAPIARRIGVR